MLLVINLVAVIVVSTVVVFQYIVYSQSTKEINARIEQTAIQNKANLENLKNESNTTLKHTKDQVRKDLQANAESTKGVVDATRVQVTKQVDSLDKATRLSLTQTEEKVKSSMDNYFKTMSQNITTKTLNTDSTTAKSVKSGKLYLGDKFVMSGVGDAHANDEWLRILGKDEKNYYGGLAANKLWAGQAIYAPTAEVQNSINNTLTVKSFANMGGDLTFNNGSIKFTKNDPGTMMEKNYGTASDRYGVGQFKNGAMRVYTGTKYAPATVNLSMANQDGGFSDIVTAGAKGATVDKKLTVFGDSVVEGTSKTNKLKLGDKFVMSGVGDAHGNDGWLRLFGNDEKNYYGGIAVGNLWTGSDAYLTSKTHHSNHVIMNNNPIILRGDGDTNHLIQYTTDSDGPRMTGCQGGQLGTRCGGDKTMLSWNREKVTVNGKLCIDDVCVDKSQLAKLRV